MNRHVTLGIAAATTVALVGAIGAARRSTAQGPDSNTTHDIPGDLRASDPTGLPRLQYGVRAYYVKKHTDGTGYDSTERLEVEIRGASNVTLGELHVLTRRVKRQELVPGTTDAAITLMDVQSVRSFTFAGETFTVYSSGVTHPKHAIYYGFTPVPFDRATTPEGRTALLTRANEAEFGAFVGEGTAGDPPGTNVILEGFIQDYADRFALAGAIEKEVQILVKPVRTERAKDQFTGKVIAQDGISPAAPGGGLVIDPTLHQPGQCVGMICCHPYYSYAETCAAYDRTGAVWCATDAVNIDCINAACLGCCDTLPNTACYTGDYICSATVYGSTCYFCGPI